MDETNKTRLIEEFMEKCRTSFVNGGFLTKDLNEDFAIDAFLQEKWLKEKIQDFNKFNKNNMDETKQGYDEKDSAFIKEIAAVINKYSMENNSNTPDFILAEMLLGFLTVFENTTRKREEWFGEKSDVGKCSSK